MVVWFAVAVLVLYEARAKQKNILKGEIQMAAPAAGGEVRICGHRRDQTRASPLLKCFPFWLWRDGYRCNNRGVGDTHGVGAESIFILQITAESINI